MTKIDCLWRLAGVALFGAAGLISLAHKRIAAAAAGGPPSGWEVLLALASFVVATLGAVLLLNGARLRNEWRSMRADKHGGGRGADSNGYGRSGDVDQPVEVSRDRPKDERRLSSRLTTAG